jgi:hypothetical protein
MKRRKFLQEISTRALAAASTVTALRGGAWFAATVERPAEWIDPATAKDWQARWEKFILDDGRKNRYCDKEMGEELGWLVSPFLDGFYYGYLATRDSKWVEMLIDWTDSCVKRGVKEPDGFTGWPKGGTGGTLSEDLYADSMLGEAMMLRPVVLMADEILKTPALKAQWGEKARSYLELAEHIYQKWDSRDCWREAKVGGLWVVQSFGIDPSTGKWTEGYERRKADGFSHPDNKENHIARWLIAMFHVTKKPVYRERSEKWWQLMKSRMKTRDNGKYFVWDYWDPAGPWDYKSDGSTKHWVGVHPNGGYYAIDAEGIVAAFEHGLVFRREDIDRLIATNRDFMWNKKVVGAEFQRIDGGQPDPRWKNSPGVLWEALVPYDQTLRKVFVANHNPGDWGGLSATPWFLSLRATR